MNNGHPSHIGRQSERRARKIIRICLKCDRPFESRGNRICPPCHEENSYYAGSAEGIRTDRRPSDFGDFAILSMPERIKNDATLGLAKKEG